MKELHFQHDGCFFCPQLYTAEFCFIWESSWLNNIITGTYVFLNETWFCLMSYSYVTYRILSGKLYLIWNKVTDLMGFVTIMGSVTIMGNPCNKTSTLVWYQIVMVIAIDHLAAPITYIMKDSCRLLDNCGYRLHPSCVWYFRLMVYPCVLFLLIYVIMEHHAYNTDCRKNMLVWEKYLVHSPQSRNKIIRTVQWNPSNPPKHLQNICAEYYILYGKMHSGLRKKI